MSSLILVSPLAVSAMISLWLGFKMRLIMFAIWLVICCAIAILLMQGVFGKITFSDAGFKLLTTLIVFQMCVFVMGVLFCRARLHRQQND